MIIVPEGDKRDISVLVERVRGSGTIPVTVPERRILNSVRTLVTGYDWAAATWDAGESSLTTLFDSTATGLSAPGTYFVQLRCVIGGERYADEVEVRVREVGP